MPAPLALTHDRLSLVRSRTGIKVTRRTQPGYTVDTVCTSAKIVVLGQTQLGLEYWLDRLSGSQLPRIVPRLRGRSNNLHLLPVIR